MTDLRHLAANRHVAHESLRGRHDAPRYTFGEMLRCTVPCADLCADPGGARHKQILFGHAFQVLDTRDGWCFGYDVADHYVGYVRSDSLASTPPPTHRVKARASHIYTQPDIKAPELAPVSYFSEVSVGGIDGSFAALATGGFIPAIHLAPVSGVVADPAKTAEMFLGVPYLWGGDSAAGIDCSGLVQVCERSAGCACPRDSDEQAASWKALSPDERPRRGDLVFWKGHVAMVLDPDTLIHANAHHMAVAREPLADAVDRIAAQGDGPVTTIRRPSAT